MAAGVREKFANSMGIAESEVIGISTTGVAGPDSVAAKEPGEVFIGLATRAGVKVFGEQFSGNRESIIDATIARCEEILLEEIGQL